MRNPYGALLLALTVLLFTPFSTLTARGQETEPLPSSPSAPTATRAASPAVAPAPGGGCDSSGLTLSRSWMLRDGQLDWWGWGFTYGSSVGIQLIDPTGKTTTIGSAPVDNLCEVGGVLTADNRVAGIYTLVVTGSRAGGASGDTAASFHIVNTSRLGTSGGFQPTPAPMPTPTPTTPCMATAAIFCP